MSGYNYWRQQATWFINPGSGNDEASGISIGAAINSFGEFARRVGFGTQVVSFPQATTVTIAASLSASDVIDGTVGGGGVLTIKGTPITGPSGSFTAVTAINRATQTMQSVADTGLGGGWSSHVGQSIRIASGSRLDSTAWIVNDLGSSVARTSRWGRANLASIFPTVASMNPSASDPYNLITLPQVTVRSIRCTSSSRTSPSQYVALQDLSLVPVSGGDFICLNGGIAKIRLFGCKLSNLHSGGVVLQCCYVDRTGSDLIWDITENGTYVMACASNGGFYVAGSFMVTDMDTIFQGTNHGINVDQSGQWRIGTTCVFDHASSTFASVTGGVLSSTFADGADLLWGSGNTGHMLIQGGGRFLWTTRPTVNGGAGVGSEINLGGGASSELTWADVPAINSSNGATCGQYNG